ncbi:peptide deformylase [Roseospirillum parvum]|uniref:Peptide deformylase n=1 Tax=Roseospirillum parvum TaxID=83401 RepID=A0A1G7ZR84_9PROT|nr:peptide deformylase [Roseospirillum parvum]SDH10630.1 peptide deformylase [Roseospirillum parvum]
MALLPIIVAPDPRLKLVAKPVAEVDDAVRQRLSDMLETMYDAPGVGLAAPQVGDSRRMLVIDVAGQDEEPRPLKIINPEIVWESEQTKSFDEGCLSLPEQYAGVERPAEVTVRYLDENGERQELTADGLLAVAIQHEIDHLDGVLFVDHVSSLRRNLILRKLTKLKRQKEKAAG